MDNLIKESNIFSNEFKARWNRIAQEFGLDSHFKTDYTPTNTQTEIAEVNDLNPAMDIKVRDDAILLHAELPGVRKEDIELNVYPSEGYAELKGKKESSIEQRDGTIHSILFFKKQRRIITSFTIIGQY